MLFSFISSILVTVEELLCFIVRKNYVTQIQIYKYLITLTDYLNSTPCRKFSKFCLCFILSYDISYDRELEGDMVLYNMSYNRMFLSISRIKYVPAKMLLFISHD